MSKIKIDNGSEDRIPSENESEIKIVNWKKISQLKEDLKIIRLEWTQKEEMILHVHDYALSKNPKDPFVVLMHIKDFENEFPLDNFKKTVESMHKQKLVRKAHKYSMKSLFVLNKKGVGSLKAQFITLKKIRDELPDRLVRRYDLDTRLNEANKILEKF